MPQYPGVTNYTIDIDGKRIPTIVPGNEQLRSDVVLGSKRRLTEDEVHRSLKHAMTTGQWKSFDEPISPLGSAFDLPSRMMEQPNLFAALGKIFGGNYFSNQIAYPEVSNLKLR